MNTDTPDLCWICEERPADSAEHRIKASDVRHAAPGLSQSNPAFLQINNSATNKAIGGSATSKALAFPPSICRHCNHTGTQPYDEAWRHLSAYLHTHWKDITARGNFDLSKSFPGNPAALAVKVHLFFVKLLGCKLLADGIAVDLAPFSAALLGGKAHPEVSLLVAASNVAAGQFISYNSDVSVLRNGDEVYSALWIYLVHPVAIKVCYLKTGAPVREPDGFPWHPNRQRKIVKISPYKGDTQPILARRDLRI
jgi:hypothetical protein